MSHPRCQSERMNKNLTSITYILDRSGSMDHLTEPAISGFNTFVKEQMDTPGDANLTLVLFDDEYEVPYKAIPIQHIEKLTTRIYTTRGCTALLDAIGKTITDLEKQITDLTEETRPGNVIISIFTDGYENASTDFSQKDINKLIRAKTDKDGWTFLFLAANQDAIATASTMSISRENSSAVVNDESGMSSQWAANSRKISSIRRKKMGYADKSGDFDKPLSEIIDEEQRNS